MVDVNWRIICWDGMAGETEARNTIPDSVSYAHIFKVSVEKIEFLYGEHLARAIRSNIYGATPRRPAKA